MPYIQTQRGTIWVADHRLSATPPILLLHGAGGTHLDWGMPIRKLSTLAPDLNGHGRSTGDGHLTIEDHAADMLALLDALNIDSITVAGHSMGGAIALKMALLAPQRVRRLALISTGARLPVNPTLLNHVQPEPEIVAELLWKWLWGPAVDEAMRARGKAVFLGLNSAVIARDYAACNAFDVRDQLSQIIQPTRILCGTDDKMTPPKFSLTLKDGIPNATTLFFEGAGHMLQLERALEIAHDLQQFTRETPTQG